MTTTALIVDDHDVFRSVARLLLEAEGLDVVGEAADGASAVVAADKLRPDVVLLDVQLPDTTGFEVARELIDTGLVHRVVLASSRDASDYGDQITRSGAAGFVAKGELSGPEVAALLVGATG